MTKVVKTTSCNERFAKIAGVNPQKRHHELATEYPAAISVRPATSASRHHVVGNAGTVQRDNETRKLTLIQNENSKKSYYHFLHLAYL